VQKRRTSSTLPQASGCSYADTLAQCVRGARALEVSVVGLGCNNFGRRIDENKARAVIDAALDVGITFFETADVYGRGESESYIGRALEGRRNPARFEPSPRTQAVLFRLLVELLRCDDDVTSGPPTRVLRRAGPRGYK
jgi:hypothetical protein